MFPLVELFVKAWNYLFHEYSESSFLKLFSFYAFVCAIMYINLLGASTGDPTHDKVMWKRSDRQGFRTRGTPWAIPPMTRSCGRDLISKASGLNGPPGPARASTPKLESVCLAILCLSPTLLTLTGGYPQPPFSGKS